MFHMVRVSNEIYRYRAVIVSYFVLAKGYIPKNKKKTVIDSKSKLNYRTNWLYNEPVYIQD